MTKLDALDIVTKVIEKVVVVGCKNVGVDYDNCKEDSKDETLFEICITGETIGDVYESANFFKEILIDIKNKCNALVHDEVFFDKMVYIALPNEKLFGYIETKI